MLKNSKKGISRPIIIVISAIILIGGFLTYCFLRQKPETPETLIKIDSPQPNQEIESPFVVKGKARGYWFFEATFTIKLLDENGNVVKQIYAQAQGDWMTEDFVPFEAVLNFSVPKNQKGILVLEKSNPSGLPENADERRIQVIIKAGETETNFSETGNLVKDNAGLKAGVWYLVYEKPGASALYVELKFSEDSLCQIGATSQSCQTVILEQGDRAEVLGWEKGEAVIVKSMVINRTSQQFQTIELYYYNHNLDKDNSGNTLCSRNGLVAVEREVPVTNTPIQDAIRLLILGNLTEKEKEECITTEYPLEGFSLTGASLNNGVLALAFSDPYNKTGGGSCRVGILWFQIEATAKQFAGIQQVRFEPEYLFQP